MNNSKINIAHLIHAIHSDEEFESVASEVFQLQVQRNIPFKTYLQLTNRPFLIASPNFLPIELFKTHKVTCTPNHDVVFKSSGTTADGAHSLHFVYDQSLYEYLAVAHFEKKYGALSEWAILALLPSYLENGDSSLVYMVDAFMKRAQPSSEFLLHQPELLHQKLSMLKARNQKTLLIGVSFALLDYCENRTFNFDGLTVMETGGMKGRRKELTRAELHDALQIGFPNASIHSEYGMTELLSQAYSSDGKWFSPAPWMRAFTTDISDPFLILPPGQRGLLAFIDLANYHSCSFIQTRDIGIINEEGLFTVEGRLDKSDLRGCNLLYT